MEVVRRKFLPDQKYYTYRYAMVVFRLRYDRSPGQLTYYLNCDALDFQPTRPLGESFLLSREYVRRAMDY